MDKITPQDAAHKQTFCSRGVYSITDNLISISTEIPTTKLVDDNLKTYSLLHKKCYNISTPSFTCILNVYAHGHPTSRERLVSENLQWDTQELNFTDVFKEGVAKTNKILVITVHDEDFEEWQKYVYRFFIQSYMSYDPTTETYEGDLKVLQDFLDGPYIDASTNEEPRTVGGGVLDPA